MKVSVTWAAAALLVAVVGASGSGLAAESGVPGNGPVKPAAVLGALAGTAVPSAELGRERGRGGIAVNVNGSAALNNGSSANNIVVGSPIAGTISNDKSIDNNVGITSVLQNFGNNSVIQTSTTINITIH